MGKRIRKEIVIGSSGIVLIITIVVIGLVLILNQSIKPENNQINNQTESNITNQTEQVFYRFENNQCKSRLLIVSEKNLNDYSTLSECQSQIIIPVKRVPKVGDFYKFDKLKLGENLSSVKSYLDEDDMPNFLMDFYLEDNGGNEYDYTQKILLEGNKMNFTIFRDSDYEEVVGLTEPTNVIGFKINPNLFILNYSIEFFDPVPWDKLAGSEIYLFGKKFIIKKVSDSPLSITLESEKGNRIDLISDSNIEINYVYNYDLRAHIIRGDNGDLNKLVIEWILGDQYFLTSNLSFVLPFFNIINFTLEDVNESADKPYGTVYLRTQEPTEEEYITPPELPHIGDRFLIEGGGKFNIGDNLNLLNRRITANDMPNFLREENGPYYYAPFFLLSNNVILSVFSDSDYEQLVGLTEPTNITGFRILSDTFILNYTIEFLIDPLWGDLEDGNLYLFGKKYHVDSVNESNLAMNLSDSEGNNLYLENAQKIVLNGERIEELSFFIKPSLVNKIDKITFQWKTDGKTFITKEVELAVPGFNTLKFVFEGMNTVPDSNGQLYGNMTLVSQ
jgi:hypothetical protein